MISSIVLNQLGSKIGKDKHFFPDFTNCISKTKKETDKGKLVLFLESVCQIEPEEGLTFSITKCVDQGN